MTEEGGWSFVQVPEAESVSNISSIVYENLTQPSWVASTNSLRSASGTVAANTPLEIPVNCSCGKPSFPEYGGLFVTYPVVAGTAGNLTGIAGTFNTTADVVKKLNPNVVWENDQPTQYAFIPIRGTTHPVLSRFMCNFPRSGSSPVRTLQLIKKIRGFMTMGLVRI